MLVKDIYNHYQTPPNLQKHQLRVAALSQILAENWRGGKLDIDSIVLCGLFHDMANIIKFNFDKPQLFKEEEKRADYWRQVHKQYPQSNINYLSGNRTASKGITVSARFRVGQCVKNVKGKEFSQRYQYLF